MTDPRNRASSDPAAPREALPETPTEDETSTVGTGSVFAIGCTIVVLIITLIGVALFVARQAS